MVNNILILIQSNIDQTAQARPKTEMGEDYNADKRKLSRHNKLIHNLR